MFSLVQFLMLPNTYFLMFSFAHFLMFSLHMFRSCCVSSVPGFSRQTRAHFLMFSVPISWCSPCLFRNVFPCSVSDVAHTYFLMLSLPISWCFSYPFPDVLLAHVSIMLRFICTWIFPPDQGAFPDASCAHFLMFAVLISVCFPLFSFWCCPYQMKKGKS